MGLFVSDDRLLRANRRFVTDSFTQRWTIRACSTVLVLTMEKLGSIFLHSNETARVLLKPVAWSDTKMKYLYVWKEHNKMITIAPSIPP